MLGTSRAHLRDDSIFMLHQLDAILVLCLLELLHLVKLTFIVHVVVVGHSLPVVDEVEV